MGGRGRGGGGGFKVELASALGYQRHQMGALQVNRLAQSFNEFPDLTGELDTRTDLVGVESLAVSGASTSGDELFAMQRDIQNRWRNSPAYMLDDRLRTDDGIRRYSDKYAKPTAKLDSLVQWDEMPLELRGPLAAAARPAKKRKVDVPIVERPPIDEAAKAGASPTKKKSAEDEEEEDDNEEGDEEDEGGADYAQQYFDNGEDYGERESGDDLDGDAAD